MKKTRICYLSLQKVTRYKRGLVNTPGEGFEIHSIQLVIRSKGAACNVC